MDRVLVAAAAVVVAALIWLEAGKDAHQEAGGHKPSPQEECYMTPGQGQLTTMQGVTLCVTH